MKKKKQGFCAYNVIDSETNDNSGEKGIALEGSLNR